MGYKVSILKNNLIYKEGSRSGRARVSGVHVIRKGPRVRIPPSPPGL